MRRALWGLTWHFHPQVTASPTFPGNLPTYGTTTADALSNSRGQTLSALLRDILAAYCRQLQENTR